MKYFFVLTYITLNYLSTSEGKPVRAKRRTPFLLPPHYAPLSVPDSFDPLLPINPFSQSVGFGYEIDDGETGEIGGDLSFPIIKKPEGIYRQWDLEGAFGWGEEPRALTFGETVSPTNILKLPINEIYHCLLDPSMCKDDTAEIEPEREVVLVPVPVQKAQPPVAPTITAALPTQAPPPINQGHDIRVSKKTIYGTKNTGR